MNVTQTVLNAITVGQLVVGIGTATLGEGVVAEEGLQVVKSEEVKIGDYVRWACADSQPITIATAKTQRLSKLEPIEYQLAICKTAETDGDLVVICRTAKFRGVAKGWAEREAVRNAIAHCRQDKE